MWEGIKDPPSQSARRNRQKVSKKSYANNKKVVTQNIQIAI